MEQTKNLRAAVIGCGCISGMHGDAIAAIPEVTMTACGDILSERAEAFSARYGGSVYTDYRELLRHEKLDVVHICTPHHLHLEMIEAAADLGIAVFTEKPPVISRAEFGRLMAASQKIPIGICFQNRFNKSVQEIHRLIAAGTLGKPMGARAFVTWSRGMDYYDQSPWRGMLDTAAGGSLINQSIHTLDLLIQFLGRPLFVDASTANRHLHGTVEVEDTVEAYLGFPDCSALFYSSSAYCQDAKVLMELCFEQAVIRMEETELCVRWKNGGVQQTSFTQKEIAGKGYWGASHSICAQAFYQSLRGGQTFSADPEGVRATMDAVFGIYDSGRTGQRIEL